jgi:hypothetical protein
MRIFAQKQKPTPKTKSANVTPNQLLLVHSREVLSVLHLQHAVGNRAVQRLMQTHGEEPAVGLSATASPHFAHDFSQIPIHPPVARAIQTKSASNKPGDDYEHEADAQEEMTEVRSALVAPPATLDLQSDFTRIPIKAPPIQRKLTISPPGDPFEREADDAADKVKGMIEPASLDLPPSAIQRKYAESEDEVKMPIQTQRAPSANPEAALDVRGGVCETELGGAPQPSGVRSYFDRAQSVFTATPDIVSRGDRLQYGGRRLESALKTTMERRLGARFDAVRIHDDSNAERLTKVLNANAFTYGNHIGFSRGRYSPQQRDSQRLLAHELTHVKQQQEMTNVRGEPSLIQLDRAPDISQNGFDTFYIGTSDNARVLAVQIGQQPGESRVSLTLASVTPRLRNPPVSQRRMPLPVFNRAGRAPRIVKETQTEVDNVGQQRAIQNIIEVKLNNDENVPAVVIALRYSRSRQWEPYPQGTFGVWRRTMVESGWVQVSDGYRELIVNFASEVPGSFHSSAYRLWRHPGLGLGYLEVSGSHRFYPYPSGRPSDADLDIVRTSIYLVPIIGPLVMIGEALVGRDIWGRRISTFERAVLGAGALLSTIGPLLRGTTSVARTVVAANNLSRTTGISRIRALWMIRGARNLSAVERSRLGSFATRVRAGEALTQAETTTLNRILGKLEEPARIASVRAEVTATTGTRLQPGRFTDLGTSTSAAESRVGQALARDLNADVVRVAESTAQGRRVGDYLINNEAAEVFSPRTTNMERLLNAAQTKQKQAGILIIDTTDTTATASSVAQNIPRLFGRPSFGGVDRVIIVEGNRVITTIVRPAAASSPATGAAIRGAASVAGQQGSRDQ